MKNNRIYIGLPLLLGIFGCFYSCGVSTSTVGTYDQYGRYSTTVVATPSYEARQRKGNLAATEWAVEQHMRNKNESLDENTPSSHRISMLYYMRVGRSQRTKENVTDIEYLLGGWCMKETPKSMKGARVMIYPYVFNKKKVQIMQSGFPKPDLIKINYDIKQVGHRQWTLNGNNQHGIIKLIDLENISLTWGDEPSILLSQCSLR